MAWKAAFPEDPYNPKGSRGPASFDIPQILTANTIYELPFGTGKRFSTGKRFADYVTGNWHVNGIFSARTGQHLNITVVGDIANIGNAGTYERADLAGNPFQSGPIAGNPSCDPPSGPTHTRTQWFNPLRLCDAQKRHFGQRATQLYSRAKLLGSGHVCPPAARDQGELCAEDRC